MVSSASSKTHYDYTGNLHRITVPVLIMAGSEDAFVTKEVLKSFYKRLSSRDKELAIFSKKKATPRNTAIQISLSARIPRKRSIRLF